MKKAHAAHAALLQELGALQHPVDVLSMLNSIGQWLRRNPAVFPRDLSARYGLRHFSELNYSQYPHNETEVNPLEELERLSAVRPANLEALAMAIRDIIWECIVTRSEMECPSCGEVSLRILVTEEDRPTATLACDICGWAGSPQGVEVVQPGKLRPPTTDMLRRIVHSTSSAR